MPSRSLPQEVQDRDGFAPCITCGEPELAGVLAECPGCGEPIHPDCLAYAGCPECPVPVPRPVRFRPGLLLRRGGAVLADTLLLLVPALGIMLTGCLALGCSLGWSILSALMVAVGLDLLNIGLFLGEGGTTLGKRLFGLRVVDERGLPLGWRRALKRELLLKGVSTFSFGLGFLWALRAGGRAWHDDVGGTRVLPAGEDLGSLLLS